MASTRKLRKVLYVITLAERGGAQSHVLELLRLAKDNYDVALATGGAGFLVIEAQMLGIPVYQLDRLIAPLSPWKDSRALFELRNVIRTFNPDLIHAHSSKAGLLARVAARIHRIPCIFTAHGWAFSDGVPPLRKYVALPMEWIAGHLGAATITVSEFDRRLALRYRIGDPERITTVLNGICDNFHRANREIGDPPIITMVARFSTQKDHLTLLRAASKVRAPFRLQFVGDGPVLESSRLTAQQLGLTSRTEFLGDRGDVSELLAASHIFALISNYEGLPIGILEAMRAGLPIVATRTGGVAEVVDHGSNGLLIDRQDENALRDALEFLLERPDVRDSFGKRSRASFEARFLSKAMARNTFALYEQELLRHARSEGISATSDPGPRGSTDNRTA